MFHDFFKILRTEMNFHLQLNIWNILWNAVIRYYYLIVLNKEHEIFICIVINVRINWINEVLQISFLSTIEWNESTILTWKYPMCYFLSLTLGYIIHLPLTQNTFLKHLLFAFTYIYSYCCPLLLIFLEFRIIYIYRICQLRSSSTCRKCTEFIWVRQISSLWTIRFLGLGTPWARDLTTHTIFTALKHHASKVCGHESINYWVDRRMGKTQKVCSYTKVIHMDWEVGKTVFNDDMHNESWTPAPHEKDNDKNQHFDNLQLEKNVINICII